MTQNLADVRAALARLIDVRPGERNALAWSFLMFFCVLASYFTVRPVREAMGVSLGKDAFRDLFTAVFFVMLALVPLYGAIVTRLPRRRVLPTIYMFFIANLVFFSFAMHAGSGSTLAATFFIWVSVYNLFVVSLFWSLMSDAWVSAQGKRLFGVISAGGTIGALVGPVLARSLVDEIGTANLPLVSAAFLGLALVASLQISDGARAQEGDTASDKRPPATLAAILQGATSVVQSPYLAQIAFWILMANLVSTFFYIEQSRLVGLTIPGKAEQVKFFAGRDLIVSAATAAIQLLGTAALLRTFGLTSALAALPLVCVAGLVAIGVSPTLEVVANVMAFERIAAFALSGPAMRVLYTVVEPDEKYKAQNFIDTVVYRGGDAASGWLFDIAGKTLGMSPVAVIALTIPLAGVWLAASLGLSRQHDARAAGNNQDPRS